MKHLLLLLAAVATLQTATASEIDSLWAVLHRTEHVARGAKSDSVAAVCADLSQYYAYEATDSARLYAERGLRAVEKTPSAVHAALINNLAETYFGEGDMNRAKELLQAAADEAAEVGDDEIHSTALSSLGVVYRRREMPDSALICYNRAAELAQKVGNPEDVGSLYVNIAVLYANMRRLPEAQTYAQKAVQTLSKCDDVSMQLYAYQTKGSIETVAGELEQATATLGSAFRLAMRNQMPLFVVKCAAPLLSAFNRLERADSIARYVRLTAASLRQIPPSSIEALGYKETLGQIELQARHYPEALGIYRELLDAKLNLATPRHALYNRIGVARAGMGDYAGAYAAMKSGYDLQDSLSKADIQQQLSDFSARYDAQQKELEIAQLQQAQAEQRASKLRYVIWSMVLIVILLLLISALLYRTRRQKERERQREAQFEAFRRQTDLRLARKYIDGLEAERTRLAKELHDGVCSDLLGLEMHMRNITPASPIERQSAEMLHRIGESVRDISHELMPPAMQYATLDEILEDYVLHLKHPEQVQLTYSAAPGIAWDDISPKVGYEIYRILQELLSNILRHSDATQIRVGLGRDNQAVVCTVSDNGSAFDIRQHTRGIGQRTIADRLRGINGEMALRSDSAGSRITLNIKMEKACTKQA